MFELDNYFGWMDFESIMTAFRSTLDLKWKHSLLHHQSSVNTLNHRSFASFDSSSPLVFSVQTSFIAFLWEWRGAGEGRVTSLTCVYLCVIHSHRFLIINYSVRDDNTRHHIPKCSVLTASYHHATVFFVDLLLCIFYLFVVKVFLILYTTHLVRGR